MINKTLKEGDIVAVFDRGGYYHRFLLYKCLGTQRTFDGKETLAFKRIYPAMENARIRSLVLFDFDQYQIIDL